MASFDTVNYSLRPNKAIQRAIVFGLIRNTIDALKISSPVYIGFGSIWFSDFHIAHKSLGIKKLVSVEADEIGYKRAVFNRPFKCVEVLHEWSTDAIPGLRQNPNYSDFPWILWLDYDSYLNEDMLAEITELPNILPESSQVYVTVNAVPHKYGKPKQLLTNLEELFGDVFPSYTKKQDVEPQKFQRFLGKQLLDSIQAAAIRNGRPGGFVPNCLLPYRDGAQMLTVGGIFPKRGAREAARNVSEKERSGFPAVDIETPPLTMKESVALQSELPRARAMSRASIRRIGFDLTEDQVSAFQEFYRYYPHFAQLV